MKEQPLRWQGVWIALAVLLPHAATLFAESQSTPSFLKARTDYPQLGLQGAVLADFNGDGILDIAAPSFGATVSVWFGNGDGTFRLGPSSPVCAPTCSLGTPTVGDFNGDGKPDLAFAGHIGGVLVVLGNGDGTFGPPITVPTSTPPNAVAVGDFNGDNKLDLAAATSAGVVVALGNGDGTFQAPATYLTGVFYGITVADVNNDGKADLLVTENSGAEVLLGNGDGTFQPPLSTPFDSQAIVINTGDFNGDGNVDVALTCQKAPCLAVMLGNGDGTFQKPHLYSTISLAFCIAVGDVNGDGVPDLVTADGSAVDGVSVFLGKGDGTFQPPARYVVGWGPVTVALGSLRPGGPLDIVSGNENGDSASVLLNNGKGRFIDGIGVNFQTGLSNLVEGDFNGDGKPDLAVAETSAVGILLGTGKAGEPFSAGQTLSFPTGVHQIAGGDFNRDGKLDLVVSLVDGSVELLLGNGDGTFTPQSPIPTGSAYSTIAVGDFNGDGNLDLATNGIYVLFGNGDGTFQPPQYVGGAPFQVTVAAADLTGDGRSDIIAGGLTYDLYVYLGQSNGTFSAPISYTLPNPATNTISVGDLNGDGMPDLVIPLGDVGGGGGNGLVVLLGNGDGTFTAAPPISDTTWNTPFAAAIADVNGDGIPDLAVTLQSNFDVEILFGNGDGTFTEAARVGTGGVPGYIVPGAFHRPHAAGMADFAVAADGILSVLINTTP